MANTQIKFTEDDFKGKLGYELATTIEHSEIDPFIARVADYIYMILPPQNVIYEEDATDYPNQSIAIKDAEMYQADYIIKNGMDLSNAMGISMNGTMLDKQGMNERELAPMAYRKLKSVGLLYRGM